jgi:prophage maintenance system killer protein
MIREAQTIVRRGTWKTWHRLHNLQQHTSGGEDGNRRMARVGMPTSLDANGYRLPASDHELADWIISLRPGTTC